MGSVWTTDKDVSVKGAFGKVSNLPFGATKGIAIPAPTLAAAEILESKVSGSNLSKNFPETAPATTPSRLIVSSFPTPDILLFV